MAKKKGRLLLIKIHDGADPGAYETFCGLTTRALTINNEEFDVTTADCETPGGKMWAEVLDGVSRISVSGNGYTKKDDAEARLATIAMASPPVEGFQVIVPNVGTFTAEMFVQSSEFGGDDTNGATFSLSLASTGAVTFAAEA
jgi:TP901-1 family phage major tail protein